MHRRVENSRLAPSNAVFTPLVRPLAAAALLFGIHLAFGAETPPARPGAYAGHHRVERSVVVESVSGARLRLTPYGEHMLRVQAVPRGAEFLPDEHLPMIERHDLGGELVVTDEPAALHIATHAADGVGVTLSKANLTARWQCNGSAAPQLVEAGGITWEERSVRLEFAPDAAEHFAGLGHGFYGRDAAPLDLRGRTISRSYGFQASLIAPWFISSKGYGFFLNCAFPHRFRFDAGGHFDVEITGTDLGAQLDYVVAAGRTPLELIARYTELTGRPRLPRRAMFGLQVTDKHREAESLAQGMTWWFDNFPKLRAAGIPVDAIIMDNTWRAGGGTWQDSIFAFDPKRYPDPKAFRAWAERMGVIVDLDFNGPMYMQSEGWKPEYGVRGGQLKDGRPFYLPNFFRTDTNDWLWGLMWRNALDPRLGYPGDMLWMDETDQANVADERAPFHAGRPWLELKSLYALAGAKALVERWDRDFAGAKRPYFWFRSATSGLQRYAVYWSGDIEGDEADQSAQIPAMLSAGICGLPYFSYDAGGWQSTDEPIYRRYGIVTGSLSPVWRTHGIKGPRWPTDYGADVVALAQRYAGLRYRLFPYLYSLARQATRDGTPMARALFLDSPGEPEAWRRDYQYRFGPSLLVAPPVESRRDVWLPSGAWFNWWSGARAEGGQTVAAPAGDEAAVYVRAGAVIPMGEFALSSQFIPADRLEVHVWCGASGAFELYEDDGTTERYRAGEFSVTPLTWDDAAGALRIGAREGSWPGAPAQRHWSVVLHGLSGPRRAVIDGQPATDVRWDAARHTLSIALLERRGAVGVEMRLVR